MLSVFLFVFDVEVGRLVAGGAVSAAGVDVYILVDPDVAFYFVADHLAGALYLDVNTIDVLAVFGGGDIKAVRVGREAGLACACVVKGNGHGAEVNVCGNVGAFGSGAGGFERYVRDHDLLGLAGAVLVEADDLLAFDLDRAAVHSPVDAGAEDAQRNLLAGDGVRLNVVGRNVGGCDPAVLEETRGVGDGSGTGLVGELALGIDHLEELSVILGGNEGACLFGGAAVDDILEAGVVKNALVLSGELGFVGRRCRLERRLDLVFGVLADDVDHDHSAVVNVGDHDGRILIIDLGEDIVGVRVGAEQLACLVGHIGADGIVDLLKVHHVVFAAGLVCLRVIDLELLDSACLQAESRRDLHIAGRLCDAHVHLGGNVFAVPVRLDLIDGFGDVGALGGIYHLAGVGAGLDADAVEREVDVVSGRFQELGIAFAERCIAEEQGAGITFRGRRVGDGKA